MTPLGKPLVFYLKYLAEMNHLNGDPEEGEEPDMTVLGDQEQVRKMAHTVGAAACEQGGDFLELCGKGIESHFSGLGANIANRRKRGYILRDWFWWAHIRPPSVPGGWFSSAMFVSAPPDIQISLEKGVCGVVVPYLWLKGGRKGEDIVRNILGSWVDSRGAEGLGLINGAVPLARIPIKIKPPESFEVDRDPLIAEVTKTFKRIGAKQTKAIASFVAGLKGADEN